MKLPSVRDKGILAASASAIFLGLSPIFGKQAILFGFSPFFVVAFRTTIACLLLLGFILIFKRQFLYIHPLGLVGCFVAGLINGIGSVFYYSSLARLDAGIGQLLYSFYPLFLVFWLFLDRQSVSKITIVRLILVLPGIFLLLRTTDEKVDFLGAGFMLLAAVFYSLHILVNQRVLYEVPSPTVTFYTLVAMSVTVCIAFLFMDPHLPASNLSWYPLIILAFITFLSRITLFIGVKHLGGMQTALLGLGELIVTVVVAQFYLGEHLTLIQWIGALFISLSLILVIIDKPPTIKRKGKGFLYWLNPPAINPTDTPFQN